MSASVKQKHERSWQFDQTAALARNPLCFCQGALSLKALTKAFSGLTAIVKPESAITVLQAKIRAELAV